jgi:hypothetical protein
MKKSKAFFSILVFGLPVLPLISMPSYAVPGRDFTPFNSGTRQPGSSSQHPASDASLQGSGAAHDSGAEHSGMHHSGIHSGMHHSGAPIPGASAPIPGSGAPIPGTHHAAPPELRELKLTPSFSAATKSGTQKKPTASEARKPAVNAASKPTATTTSPATKHTATTTTIITSAAVTKPAAPRKITQEDLEFGTEQLQQLLEDRPQMEAFIEENDAIWKKAVRGFAGETAGCRVEWNPESLKDKPAGYIADHVYPSENDPRCFIRLAAKDENGADVEGERLWSGLFYEFNNLANQKTFEAVNKLALDGRLTKKEWMNHNCFAEYKAFKTTLNFYNGVFAPLMFKRNIKTHPVNWRIVQWRDTYPAWIAQFRNPRAYPYNYWGHWWDSQIYPYLKRSGKLNMAAQPAPVGGASKPVSAETSPNKDGKKAEKPLEAGQQAQLSTKSSSRKN